MKALAKDPAARFQSMEDFRKAIVGEVKVAAPAIERACRRLSNPATTRWRRRYRRAHRRRCRRRRRRSTKAFELKPKRTKMFVSLGGGAALAVAVGYFVFLKETPPAAAARRDDHDDGGASAPTPPPRRRRR